MQKMTLLFIQCYEYRFQGRPVHTLPAHVIIVSEADTCALSGIQVFDFIYTNHIHHHLCMPAASTSVSD